MVRGGLPGSVPALWDLVRAQEKNRSPTARKREKPERSKRGGRQGMKYVAITKGLGRGVSRMGGGACWVRGGKSENERYGISNFNENLYSVANESQTL